MKHDKQKNCTEALCPKIVLYGQHKTGTTAAFLRIKNSLKQAPRELFEEPVYKPCPEDRTRPVLAKVIIPPDLNAYAVRYPDTKNPKEEAEKGLATFRNFDKQIVLLRDPRDWLVSGTLFLPQEKKEVYGDKTFVAGVIDMLKQKEHDPRSVSLLDMLEVILQVSGNAVRNIIQSLITEQHEYIFQFEHSLDEYIQWKYEDMISGRSAHVEKYLGFKLLQEAENDTTYDYVARAKGSGDWQHWLTPQDVEFFAPLMKRYIEKYAYDREWRLSPNPHIHCEHASGYVARTVKRKQILHCV